MTENNNYSVHYEFYMYIKKKKVETNIIHTVQLNLPKEIKINSGVFGLNQSPQSPKEMRSLKRKEKSGIMIIHFSIKQLSNN